MTNTPNQPAPEPELDPASLAAIQNLLRDEAISSQVEEKPVAERESPPVNVASRPKGRAALPLLEEAPVEPMPRRAKPAARPGILTRGRGRLQGYRPTPKQIILACLALIIVLRPWLVVGVLFVTVFLVLGLFLALGYDGFWRRAMGLGRWYAARNPERAVALHARLDAFAMRWDAVLDRFPEGTVDGLYLPDFGEMAAADARHDAALDRRFDSLRNSEG